MTPPLLGQVAIVTGAASGIGAATARRLAVAGADVALLDRDPTAATAALVEAEGRRALPLTIDLRHGAGIAEAVGEVLSALGRVDVLVNAAGTTGPPEAALLLDTPEDAWDLIFAVNVKAPFLLLQQVARHMIERGGGGRVVNVTSSSAHRARSRPAYGSSKAALEGLTRVAAAELGPHGINVNSVAPGVTRTQMTEQVIGGAEALEAAVRSGRLGNLLGRLSEPDDVAGVIVFLCLPESRQITAATLHTSAGAVA